jgi:hypothetical protein
MKKSILALAFAALLSACGQDVVTVGKLTVNISGLPSGSTPSVAVTGPLSFTKTLTASGTLENLTTASVTAGQTASSTVTYSKTVPVEVTLPFADFTGGAADSSTQGGKFVSYSYAGTGTATIAAGQPVKGTDSLSTDYTISSGNFGGVALGVNANAAAQPVDLTMYTKLRIKLARSGGGAVSVKIVGNEKAVQDNGCYPVFQDGNDNGVAVTATLTEYTLDISKFAFRSFCGAPDRKTIAETINNVVRLEIEDRFLPGTGSETRTMTLGSITFVK